MSQLNIKQTGPHVASQVAATWAALDAASRDAQLQGAISSQDWAFLDASREMEVIRDFVGSPETILGNPSTKHGEIAEQVHVGVNRAFDALHGRGFSATFEGVGRFDPVDYRVGDVDIQSKYINGLRNTLDHVLGHAQKYPEFAQGSGQYHIPSDQFEQLGYLQQEGAIDGLSTRANEAVQRKLDDLQAITGRSAEDMIKPGEASYAEVQKGRIHDTIESRENKLDGKNDELKEALQKDHGPSFTGLGQAAALGAGAGAGVRLGQALWIKSRGVEGKNPFKGEFTPNDWHDVGVATAKGAGGGAIAGGALYMVTNATNLAAPFAGSLVSGLMGVGDLLRQYKAKNIDADQFVVLSQIVAADAAVVGLASAAGQVIIPIPVLGALVGSLAGKLVASALKEGLGNAEAQLSAKLEAYEKWALAELDDKYREELQRLDAYFGNLRELTQLAFSENVNTTLRLKASISFAEAVGVPEHKILRTPYDLDVYMSK